uniref:Exoribonuclease phosphorolytic domain-containing protein n=1 Tax=Strombidium rassoulzadegani TaxID=1082188 RepID=A0A7S3CKJ4_9SPIT|mmetsp:Transcript_11384/g.19195  ORF Transcript_11384/g.19195 Transcript_11384/m.19195 type:complete len:396 (+) Transcript_11384:347-1534(+)
MRIELQNFIEKVVRNSRATDKEGLCIIQGKLVWSVTVNLQLLNDDGNSFDALFLAAMLALKNTRLPEVTLSRNVIKIDDSKLKYLNVHHLPVQTTFYFLKGLSAVPVLDVNTKEEKLCDARFSIVMNTYEDLCGMTTLGALNLGKGEEAADYDQEEENDEMQSSSNIALTQGVDHTMLFQCIDLAASKAKVITELVRKAWEEKERGMGLIDFLGSQLSVERAMRSENESMKYIEQVNSELEENRKKFPTKEDEDDLRELESLNDSEDKIGFKDRVNNQNGFRKRQILNRPGGPNIHKGNQRSNSRNSTSFSSAGGHRDQRGSQANVQEGQRPRQQRNERELSHEDRERKQQGRENARDLRERLEQIEAKSGDELQLNNAIRQKRQRKYDEKSSRM